MANIQDVISKLMEIEMEKNVKKKTKKQDTVVYQQYLECLKNYMVESNLKFVPLDKKYYAVLKTKFKKPTLTIELVGGLFVQFLKINRTSMSQWTVDQMRTYFTQYIEKSMIAMTEEYTVCEITDKRPVDSFLAEMP